MPKNLSEAIAALQKRAEQLAEKGEGLTYPSGPYERKDYARGGGSQAILGYHLVLLTHADSILSQGAESQEILKRKEIVSKFHHVELAQFLSQHTKDNPRIAMSVSQRAEFDLKNFLTRTTPHLDLNTAYIIIAQCVRAVKALHDKNVVHRDISLPNFFVNKEIVKEVVEGKEIAQQRPHVYLGDMRTLREVDDAGIDPSPVVDIYNRDFSPREIMIPGKKNLKACDIYSLGRVLEDIYLNISSDTPPDDNFRKNIINRMLSSDPAERPTITDIINHPLMIEYCKLVNNIFDFPITHDGRYILNTNVTPGIVDLYLPRVIDEAQQALSALNNIWDVLNFAEMTDAQQVENAWEMLSMKAWAAKETLEVALQSEEMIGLYMEQLAQLQIAFSKQLAIISAWIYSHSKSPLKFDHTKPVTHIFSVCHHLLNISKLPMDAIERFMNEVYIGLLPQYRNQALILFLSHPNLSDEHKAKVKILMMQQFDRALSEKKDIPFTLFESSIYEMLLHEKYARLTEPEQNVFRENLPKEYKIHLGEKIIRDVWYIHSEDFAPNERLFPATLLFDKPDFRGIEFPRWNGEAIKVTRFSNLKTEEKFASSSSSTSPTPGMFARQDYSIDDLLGNLQGATNNYIRFLADKDQTSPKYKMVCEISNIINDYNIGETAKVIGIANLLTPEMCKEIQKDLLGKTFLNFATPVIQFLENINVRPKPKP